MIKTLNFMKDDLKVRRDDYTFLKLFNEKV